MEESVLSSIVLPLAIMLIMVSMGMSLTVEDFRRVLIEPKQVSIGLLSQVVLLPLIGFVVVAIFQLQPIYAIGLMLLAAAPGGSTSNLIVHTADGDRALSVTLTALSNAIVWLTMPFLLNFAAGLYGDDAQITNFPIVSTMVQVAALSVVPVLIGMGIRRVNVAFAERTEKISKIVSAAFLFVIILALVAQNWETIVTDGPRFAPAFILLNLAGLVVGYGVSRLARINHVQSATISIETGIQNGTLAITIAFTVLGNGEYAVIPGLYSIWMYISGFAIAYWLARGSANRAPISAATTQ